MIILFARSKGRIDVDDAYIGYRYAQNFASGLGLVYNPGENVFALTTVLWGLLLGTLARITEASVEDVASILSLCLLICSALGAYAFGRRATLSHGLSLLLTALILISPSFLLVCTLGMETPLYGPLILCAGAAIVFDRPLVAGIFAGLAFATRPDGLAVLAALIAVIVIDFVFQGRRVTLAWSRLVLRTMLGFAMPAVPYLAFCYSQFGRYPPHSLSAKRALPFMISRWWMPLHFVKGPGIPVVLFSLAGLYFLFRFWRRYPATPLSVHLRLFVFCFSWLSIYAVAWTIVRIDLYPWYIGAMGPASAALVIGVLAAVAGDSERILKSAFAVATVALGFCWAWHAVHEIHGFRLYLRQLEEPRKRLALAIREATTSEQEVVGAGAIGIVGYFCGGCRISDYAGLVTTPETRAAAPPETLLVGGVEIEEMVPKTAKLLFETSSSLPSPELLVIARDPSRTTWNSSLISPEIKLDARFGKTVSLVGVSPVSRNVARGDFVNLQALWHFDEPLPPHHVISYYLGNSRTPRLVYKDTNAFFNRRVPHGTVKPGESVCDFVGLRVPSNAAPGDYELSVLVYPPDGFEGPLTLQSKLHPGMVHLYDVHIVESE